MDIGCSRRRLVGANVEVESRDGLFGRIFASGGRGELKMQGTVRPVGPI